MPCRLCSSLGVASYGAGCWGATEGPAAGASVASGVLATGGAWIAATGADVGVEVATDPWSGVGGGVASEAALSAGDGAGRAGLGSDGTEVPDGASTPTASAGSSRTQRG